VVLLGCLGWLAITRGMAATVLVRTLVAELGPFGPVVFVLLYAAAAVAFLPMSLMAAVAGVLFGPVLGVPLVWLGTMLGAVGAFAIGRGLSRRAVEQLAGRHMSRANALLERHGAAALFLLRLLPVGPFALLNYIVAVTNLGFGKFLLGTGAGILPGVVIYVALGGALSDPTSPAFVVSVGALLLLVVGGALAARRVAQQADKKRSPEE
jgi:uncharacterized membrane protein YdjX (TVP38/TMEM64 family)